MLRELNIEEEWSFIKNETHKENPNNQNIIKRELLFTLQLLMANIANKRDEIIYTKSKEYYLTL